MESEGIWVENQYYILATGTRTAVGSWVLKHGDTFSVFDGFGDIAASGGGEYGLYHDGTRHLSRLTLRLGRDRPLLLSSRTSADNVLFGADLTNPDVLRDGAIVLRRDLLHVFRSRFLFQGTAYERLRIVNYSGEPVSLPLVYRFDADFADIFEVRGTRRPRRGTRLPARSDTDTVELAYRGLDGAVRRTRLIWTPAPAVVGESSVRFDITLESHGSAVVSLRVESGVDESGDGGKELHPKDPDKALAALERDRDESYATISTANEQFNAWLTRSLADIRMMISDTPYGPYPYAGVPWFSTAFGRDGIITALELLWLNPRVARGVLGYLAATQADSVVPEQDAEPGKILHETRGGEMAALGEVPFGRYYGSVDATPLFVLLAAEYYHATGDLAFLESIATNIDRALAWMRDYGGLGQSGFLVYERRSESGLVHQGWKDSADSVFHADGSLAEPPIALCEVQGYAYAALKGAATLAQARGKTAEADALAERAATLRERFEELFWSEELGTYALALDGHGRPCQVRSSNAGQCLFSGIADERRAARLAKLLLSDDLFSGWGIRTIGEREVRYNPMSYHNGSVWPHDNAIIAAGLARYGLTGAVMAILGGLFDTSLLVDLQRLPELFCGFRRRSGEGPTLYPVACAPQAWAAGAPFLMLQAALGLTVDAVHRRVWVSHARLPAFLDQVSVRGLQVGPDASVDLLFDRHAHDVAISVPSRTGDAAVIVTK